MSRQFGLSRREASVGGGWGKPPGAHALLTPRDSILLPPSRPIFELFEVSDPPVHKFKPFERALFFFVTSAAFVGGIFLLFV